MGSISHIVRKDSILEERLWEKFRLGESVMGSAEAVREASAGAKTLIIFQPSVSRARYVRVQWFLKEVHLEPV